MQSISAHSLNSASCPAVALQRLKKHAGFTLVELLVVLVIIGVMISVSIPTIEAMSSPKYAVRKQARRVRETLASARKMSLDDKVTIDVWVDYSQNQIQLVKRADRNALMQLDSLDRPTNLYQKVILFEEDFVLTSFAAADIMPDESAEEAAERPESQGMEDDPDVVMALSFFPYGGCDGGGVGIGQNDFSLHLAPDVLTGRARVVQLWEAP